ncbi:MAG TPA: ATP-binding protein [Burkholderiaceae bacterium]|jgi:two-component system osmolarity sensor histidine kinase EnvZ|nr:ATP-binding protein [Burkholderiaceae bacterium]
MKLLPLPMFGRIFIALLLMTISALILIAATFGNYQDRVIAMTLAPMWAAAIRTEQEQPGPSQRALDLRMRVDVFGGAPPPQAYSIVSDGRTAALTDALAQSGISVIDTRLDDKSELPVTWLKVQPAQGEARWVGLAGGVQPSSFRMRAWGVIGVLILVITIAAWFTSRWVVRPVARLARQVDAIGRGEVPTETVRGTREIERLGTALATMARQRAAFDEQRRVMLMGVSHDLRSPLTRIRVAAELLAEQPQLRDLIVRNVEHADAIIESFLSYVRTDAERIEDNVDLSAVAASAAKLAGLQDAQIRIAPGAVVRGNATMLQRMLANLLDNAARHGAPPVVLSVAVDHAARQATLIVEDRGPGIVDPKRMLQPFERGDASRAHGGAGLGLAIVARIIERHAGRLDIGGVDGGGARVTVRLPLADGNSD